MFYVTYSRKVWFFFKQNLTFLKNFEMDTPNL